MAYKGITGFIDHIAHMYREETNVFHQITLLEVMLHFDGTVLETGKFKCQRQYLKDTIKDLNPGFYEGYYNKKRKP